MEPLEAKGSMQRGIMAKHPREKNTGQKPLVCNELKPEEEKVAIKEKMI